MTLLLVLLGGCAQPGETGTKVGPGGSDSAPGSWWYADADGDGHGDPAVATQSGSAPEGYVVVGDDCDDSDPAVHPGATETCDGVDEDCDGAVDDDATDSATWYRDADGDGVGNAAVTAAACSAPEGYVALSGDCDDTDAAVSPLLPEVCGDGLDNDCAGDADPRCGPMGEYSLGEVATRVSGSGDGAYAGIALSLPGSVATVGNPVAVVGERSAPGTLYVSEIPRGLVQSDNDAIAELVLVEDAPNWIGPDPAHPVGDLDGDGLDDLLVAAGRTTSDSPVLGWFGPVTGSHTPDDADFSVDNAVIGESVDVARVASSSESGPPDLLFLGCSGCSGAVRTDGEIVVLQGSFTGTMTVDDIVASLRPDPADIAIGLGASLCAVDLDGDGILDVAAGGGSHSSEDRPAWEWGGAVLVALGPLSGDIALDDGKGGLDEGDGLWGWAPTAYTRAGETLSCGDVDGDGLPDVLVGSEDVSDGDDAGLGPGDAWLLTGPATGTHTFDDAAWTVAGDDAVRFVGYTVSADGDVDADGRADILVGSAGTDHAGLAGLWYGSSLSGATSMTDADATWSGEAPDDFALWVVAGSDFDADSYGDFAIGAYANADAGLSAGMVYFVFGGPG